MNSHDEPDWLEPDFDEPEPPDFAAAPAVAASPVAGAGAASTAIVDPAVIAQRLGWSLPPEALLDATRIGTEADLCPNDAMWPLILLQLRAAGAYNSVPSKVTQAIDEATAKAREAIELQIKMATLEAANSASKAVKKDIFKALSEGDHKSLKPLLAVAAGASFVSLTIGGVIGFWLGNLSNIQHVWVLTLAKIFGIGV